MKTLTAAPSRPWAVALALGAILAPALGLAQDTPVPDKGDTAWMMTSTVLVILMTIPGLALFYAGIAFAYYVVFPLMFQFLASTTPAGVKMMTDIANYLDFVLLLFMAFGIAFEMPVAVVLLVVTGLVKLEVLTRNRGYVILGIFIIAAFLTPPDEVSQSFMAVPMYLLYELGILFARMIQKSRGAPATATES